MKLCKEMLAFLLPAVLLYASAVYVKETVWKDTGGAFAFQATEAPSAVQTVLYTTAPTEKPTEQPTEKPTEQPAEDPTDAPAEEPTETPTQAENSDEQEETQKNIEAMCTAFNAVKHMTDFSASKTQRFSFQIEDSSVSFLVPAGNMILDRLCRDEDFQFDFVNGLSKNPEKGEPDVTPNEALPPTNFDMVLDPAGLVSVSAAQEGNNTVYTAVIAQEQVSIDSYVPYYHSLAMDYLDFSQIDVSPSKITRADITYYDSTIKVSVDNTTGMLSGFEQIVPIGGIGEIELFGVSASGEIRGEMYEGWTFRF